MVNQSMAGNILPGNIVNIDDNLKFKATLRDHVNLSNVGHFTSSRGRSRTPKKKNNNNNNNKTTKKNKQTKFQTHVHGVDSNIFCSLNVLFLSTSLIIERPLVVKFAFL